MTEPLETPETYEAPAIANRTAITPPLVAVAPVSLLT
jgi:hypothetical protein